MSNNPQTLEDTKEEYLDKLAKLQVARQAILTQDLAALAVADRRKVRRLEEKHLFGGSVAGEGKTSEVSNEEMGDIIVCDDYHEGSHNNLPSQQNGTGPAPNPLIHIPTLQGAAFLLLMGIAVVAFILWLFRGSQNVTSQNPTQGTSTQSTGTGNQPPQTPSNGKVVTLPEPQFDAVTEELQPDGTWKEIKRERIKIRQPPK